MKNTLKSLKAVADEIRVRILLLLFDREACVCELMSVFGMAQSKLSHHLITLRDAGFLQDEKRGKWNYYRLDTKLLDPANRELILSLYQWLIDDETIARDKKTLARVKKRMQVCS
jgi:ArsR family transcriptional regulator